jgi:nucleoside-diphosphate-sugar epimerase
MFLKKILILGSTSFASKGLIESLDQLNVHITCFNRGEININGKTVTGPVLKMIDNPYLSEPFDLVINYMILKEKSVQLNLEFLEALTAFCNARNVKHLIQISSISVYPNEEKLINELSPIEENIKRKGRYAAIKIAVDQYLSKVNNLKFSVCYVRPGFILADDKEPSLTGILKRLPFNIGILLGDKSSTLPTIYRHQLNDAMAKIVMSQNKEKVYIITSKTTDTKYNFVINRFNFNVFVLPKHITLMAAKVLYFFRIFSYSQYMQVRGLFKSTVFDPSNTETKLNIHL